MRSVAIAFFECGWDCDDSDDENDPEALTCATDPAWQRTRCCDGKGPDKPIFGGQEFGKCPVKWRSDYPAEQALVQTYLDCTGGVIANIVGAVEGIPIPAVVPMIHLPFPGSVGEQPAHIMQALNIIRGVVSKMLSERTREHEQERELKRGK